MLRRILFLLVISLVIVHPLKAQKEYKTDASMPIEADVSELCSLSAARMEEKYYIKDHLLQTISSVETGNWNYEEGRFVSWPWTINVNGKGYRFKTKEAAIAKVKQLQSEGVESIDVGCMQVNLKYHKKAFASLDDAFNPDKNMEYGAKFLSKLYKKQGSWQKAAMAYHSKVPARGLRYKNKLLSRFEQIKLAAVAEEEQNISLF